MKTGLLLINLGTPKDCTERDVRTYLKEFLSDPLVIDINPVLRTLLLRFIILPFRSKKSAAAYQKIWMKEGSPLLVYSQRFHRKLEEKLGPDIHVQLAMRYQEPSVQKALQSFKRFGVERIVVFPLFPQYSLAAWESATRHVWSLAEGKWTSDRLDVIPPFYNHEEFIQAWAEIGRKHLSTFSPDKILMSFHGIPERHCRKTVPADSNCCEVADCCNIMSARNRNCYRAQCFVTAKTLAKELKLSDDDWQICFQSRLGRTPWIKPYTDEVLKELAATGVKKLLVFSPSFVTDCLETSEEIAMRAKEDFIAAGGEQLELVPSLNADDHWIDAAATIALKYIN